MAVYFDRASQYIRARWSGNQSLPIRIAFWASTHWTNQILWRVNHDTDNRKYLQIGIDAVGKWYVECSTFATFPTPGIKVARATSTYAVSRNEWVYITVEILGFADRRIRTNGVNYAADTTSVVTSGGPEMHLGASADNANGPEQYPPPAISTSGNNHPNMFLGYLSDFCYWRGVAPVGLSVADALAMYDMGLPNRYWEPDKIQHYWQFEGPQFHDEIESVAWSTPPEIVSRRVGIVEYTGQVTEDDTLVAGSHTYRWKATPVAASDIQIAAGSHASFQNLCLAFNLDGSSSNYHSSTTKNTEVWGFWYQGQRGDNNGDCVVVYEQDPSPSGGAPTLNDTVDAGGVMTCLDYEGNTITALPAAKEYLPLKRSPIWYDGSSSDPLEPDAFGATNHGHMPPISYRPTWVNVGGGKPGQTEIDRQIDDRYAARTPFDRAAIERFQGLPAGVSDRHAGQAFRRDHRAYVA